MIIAINGKKQSGKDTVGKIIQYLTSNYYKSKLSKRNRILSSEEIDFKNFFITNKQSNWEIKKFADKLKDIVALLIGCTREQLEDEEFKNKELSKEWWIWKLTYLGKTEFFNTKKEAHKYRDDNFYGAGITEQIKPTPRFLLQYIGTDLFRNQLHPNIWVNSLMSKYKPKYIGGIDPASNSYIKSQTLKIYPDWIITDLRFPNELKAVEDKNGITIRINRHKQCITCETHFIKGKECPKCSSGNWVYGNIDDHISETILDDVKFDYVIDNNGTVEELIEKVKEILTKEGLL